MFVDNWLKFYGREPSTYPDAEYKWIVIFSETLIHIYPYLPYFFALLPWLYFFRKKDNHKKDLKEFRKRIIIFSILGLIFGYIFPMIVLGILASLAANSLYGGTI